MEAGPGESPRTMTVSRYQNDHLQAFLESCFHFRSLPRGWNVKVLGLEIMALALEGLRALFQRKMEVYSNKEF